MIKLTGTIGIIIDSLMQLPNDKIYDVIVKDHKEKRTIDQNSYYWKLLTEYSNWAHHDAQRLHNELIELYGQPYFVDDTLIQIKLPKGTDIYSLNVYLRHTYSLVEEEDGIKEIFHLMRGSSEYNTEEMSILIDGLINQIKGSEAPIETMTSEERAELWGNWL